MAINETYIATDRQSMEQRNSDLDTWKKETEVTPKQDRGRT